MLLMSDVKEKFGKPSFLKCYTCMDLMPNAVFMEKTWDEVGHDFPTKSLTITMIYNSIT